MLFTQKHHILILSLCVGVHFAAVTFLLPVLSMIGTGSPLLEATFALAHIAMLPVMGRLSDRYGTRRVLLWSLIGQALAFSIAATSLTFEVLFVARIIAGASSAVLPVCFAWIRRHVCKSLWSRSYALIMLGITAGGGLGALISGVLFEVTTWLPNVVMLVMSLSCILAVRALPLEQRRYNIFSFKERMRNFMSMRALVVLACVFLMVSSGFHLFRTLISFRFEDPVFSGVLIGLIAFGSGLAQVALALNPVEHDPFRLFLFATTGVVLAFALGTLIPTPIFIVSLILLSVSIGTSDVWGGIFMHRLIPGSIAGEMSGVVFGIGALGKICGPIVAMWTVEFSSITHGFSIAFLCGFFGLAFLLAIKTKRD